MTLKTRKAFFNDKKASTMLLLALCTFLAGETNASLLDPGFIGKELQTFARDVLGVDEMQSYLESLHYHKGTVRGDLVTPELAAKLSDKFKIRFEVVKRLKTAVEASYVGADSVNPTPQEECCKVDKSTLKYDIRFHTKVDMDSVCLKISSSTSALPNPVYLDEGVAKEMRDISRTYPFIKWQYFGSEQGVMTTFPVYDDKEDCGRFDARFRPWYVEAATQEAKDVVLVIDISASMTGEKLHVAKVAAKTVLDTMNPKDQVGVVSFSTLASTPGDAGGESSCYSERLAQAVPTNIKKMKYFVDGLVPHGLSQYKLAFEKAFSLFKGSVSEESGQKKKRVILFLTDGEPSDMKKDAIFRTIRNKNVELNNSVIILTYGFGNANQTILEDIAKQNTAKYGIPANISVGDITTGRYKYVKDFKTLRVDMATYYDLFSLGTHLDPVVSVPYMDAFGLGQVLTISLSCFHNGKFIGVVGTDITVQDLLSDITFFNQGQSTYAFMISNSGRTLIHPLLPAPTDAYGDPFFMDITTLEPDAEFKEVFDSIKKGKSGSKSFVAKRFLPRGGTEKQGVTETEVNCTYFWTPLMEVDFTVGVVVPVGHAKDQLKPLRMPNGYSFNYHRIDIYNNGKICSHFGANASKDTTSVKFAPGAYKDPYSYIGKDETKTDVELLIAYMTDDTGKVTNPGLKNDIRDTVIATWKVEGLWLRDKIDLTQYLVWRFIGTSNGVVRSSPGVVMDKRYDPRQRPWYYSALAHTGLLALTAPYLDLGGAGVVITASRALYHGEPSLLHYTNDEVLGVIGADFPLSYFHRLLTDVYPKCKETKTYSCFVMDSGGFLIMHEDFLLPSATSSDLQFVHITEKEKNIAEDLIKKKYLVKKHCRHLEAIQKQSFYELHLPPRGADTLRSGARCSKYQLQQIVGTNAFLGVAVKDSFCPPEPCSCSTDTKCSLLNLTCECPCISHLDFHYCHNQFYNSSLPICAPSAEEVLSAACGAPSHIVQIHSCNDPVLEDCFVPRCTEKNTSETCEGIIGCFWCENNKDDIPLEKPYCASAEVCFKGREVEKENCPSEATSAAVVSPPTQVNHSSDVKPSSDRESRPLSYGAICGIVTGCVVVEAAMLIVVVLTIRRCRNKSIANASSSTEQIFVSGTQSASADSTQRRPSAQPKNGTYNVLERPTRFTQTPITLAQEHSYENVIDDPPAVPARKQLTRAVSEASGSSGQTSVEMSTLDSSRKRSSNADRQEDVSPKNVRTGAAPIPAPVNTEIIFTPPEAVSKEERVSEDQQQTSASDAGCIPQEINNVQQLDGNITQKTSEKRPSNAIMPPSIEANEQQYDSNPPVDVRTRRESSNSTVLDPEGYIICVV